MTVPHHDSAVSRRAALAGLGAVGLSLAFATGHQAVAQDATPAASGELPEGVTLTSLSGLPIRDLPTKPFALQVYRVSLEPGASLPNAQVPYVSTTYVEEGNFVCPPGGEGRYIYDAEGNIVDSGAHEMAYPLGTWCYTEANTMDGIRNDTTERATILVIDLVPVE